MKRLLLAAAAIAAAALAEAPGLGSVPLDENPRPGQDTWPGEVIVEFTRDLRADEANEMIREAGGERARRAARGGRWLVQLEAGRSVETALARFRAMPEVDYAEANGVLRSHLVPNDPLYSLQWHLRALNAERVWDIQRGDA